MPCWNATSLLQVAPLVLNSASQAAPVWQAEQVPGPDQPCWQEQVPLAASTCWVAEQSAAGRVAVGAVLSTGLFRCSTTWPLRISGRQLLPHDGMQLCTQLPAAMPRNMPHSPRSGRQGTASGSGVGAVAHAAAPLSSAGKRGQKPDGMSQAAPAQPHAHAQATLPLPVGMQRPLGPQSAGHPNVVCGREAGDG